MASTFKASNIVYSQEYKTVAMMDVNFNFSYKKYVISGFSQAYRTFTVNGDGNIKKLIGFARLLMDSCDGPTIRKTFNGFWG